MIIPILTLSIPVGRLAQIFGTSTYNDTEDAHVDPITDAEFVSLSNAQTRHLDGFQHIMGAAPPDSEDWTDGLSVPPSPVTEDNPGTRPSTPASRRGSPSRSPASRPAHRCPDPLCARNFTSDYTLAKHMKSHLPKAPRSFPCTMGCTMDFSRKHDRLRHEVAQHGRVCEAECSSCLGFFSSEATLKKHKCKPRARP
jgi:hypothetical protein